MTTEFKTNARQSYEEFVASRKKQVGGSDIGKIAGVSRWGCPRSVAYDKLDVPKDFPDDDKPEFRRGRRLEGVACSYYEEVTGREVRITTTARVKDKPHLAINMDRLVYKKEDTEKKDPGYLEAKVLGRYSFLKVKKEGIPDDWILQVQYGCGVKGVTWGAYAIYAPELDELLHFDVVYDGSLGENLLEKADDFWNLSVECGVLPEPLPSDSQQCEGCAWAITCQGGVTAPASAGVVERPDLEALAAKFAEVKGMGSEASDAEDELKAEILAAIKEQPGTYRCGKYEFKFDVTEQKRFVGAEMKKAHPDLYEKFTKTSIVKTLKKPKEV